MPVETLKTAVAPESCRNGPGGGPCGKARREPFTADQCPICWINSWTREEHSRRAAGGGADPVKKEYSFECIHVGKSAPPPEGRDVRKRYYQCEAGKGVVCACDCGPKCDKYRPDLQGQLLPLEPVAVTTVAGGLAKGPAHARFNASIIRYKGDLILAYRTGWAGARVHLNRLDESFKPIGPPITLYLNTPKSEYGQEDPRLFVFHDRLHVSFTGVVSENGAVKTNVLYARLNDRLMTEEIFYPHFAQRMPWEKNWVFFERFGELFAVYSTSPHVVLHVVGTQAYPFTTTPNPFPWSGGHLRGGASPVRVGDHFYHFFHGRGGVAEYSLGVCVFEADPPFRIVRQTADPIYQSDPKTKPADQYIDTVFPCGAVLGGDKWHVSMGVHDRTTDVVTFSVSDVERALG